MLGARAELAPDSAEALRLERDVIALYAADYAKQWDAMLADLNLVPLRSPEQAVQDLYILASPQSPMRDLLASIARQLTLSQPPLAGARRRRRGSRQGCRQGGRHRGRAANAADGGSVATAGAGGGRRGRVEPPGKQIDERYRALRDYVGTGPALRPRRLPGAPIEQAFKAMDALRQQLARLAERRRGTDRSAAAKTRRSAARAEASGAPAAGQSLARSDDRQPTALRSGGTAEQVKKASMRAAGRPRLCSRP